MGLEQPHVLGTEPVGRLTEVCSQFAHHTDVSTRSILRIVSTLEFFQQHRSQAVHRDLLCTHTFPLRARPHYQPTRGVRRASGLLETPFYPIYARIVDDSYKG